MEKNIYGHIRPFFMGSKVYSSIALFPLATNNLKFKYDSNDLNNN